MHDYSEIKDKLGRKVSQTIDSPITVFEFWELSDVFIALYHSNFRSHFLLMVDNVYSAGFFLVIGPIIKRRNNRGVFLHWPYSRLNMSLPSLINPKGKRKFSD